MPGGCSWKNKFCPQQSRSPLSDFPPLGCSSWKQSHSGLLFFPSGLEIEKEGVCFLGRPESPGFRLQGQYCLRREWPGLGWRRKEGEGRYSWARMVGVGVCVKAAKICMTREWHSALQCQKGPFPSLYCYFERPFKANFSLPKSTVIHYFHFQLLDDFWGMKSFFIRNHKVKG